MTVNVDPLIIALIKEREGIDNNIAKARAKYLETSAKLRDRKKKLNRTIVELAELTDTPNEKLKVQVRTYPQTPCPLCGQMVGSRGAYLHLWGQKLHGKLSDAKVEQTAKKIKSAIKLVSAA